MSSKAKYNISFNSILSCVLNFLLFCSEVDCLNEILF
jgi:hypothetical protein